MLFYQRMFLSKVGLDILIFEDPWLYDIRIFIFSQKEQKKTDPMDRFFLSLNYFFFFAAGFLFAVVFFGAAFFFFAGIFG